MTDTSGFPKFAAGMNEDGMSAREMNRMSGAARKADNLTAGSGVQIRRGASGNVLSVEPPQGSHILSTTRFVAVVVPPMPLDTTVIVRDVVYAIEAPEPVDLDPNPDDEIVDLVRGEYTYRWGSPGRITALPGYGYTPMDFAGSVFKDVDANGGAISPTGDMVIFWLELRGQGPPLLWPMNTQLTRQFKIIDMPEMQVVYDNYLKVHTWDGSEDTEGEAMVHVARPWLLRANPEPYERHGITYTDVSPQERLAHRAAQTEEQVVTPRYYPGDIIYASTGIAGGLDGAWGPNLPFTWLDDNRDGRAWAEKNPANV